MRKGAALSVITSSSLMADRDAWAINVAQSTIVEADQWVEALAAVAAAIGKTNGAAAPLAPKNEPDAAAQAIAASLLSGERKAILLGNAAAHHAQASSLLALANWIGAQTGATVGYLTEAANTVGAQLVGAYPKNGGLDAGRMLAAGSGLKAVLLLNTEPVFDSAAGAAAADVIGNAQMVVTLSPFKANLEFSDVLLPIAPFTETPGTFVNAEGRLQGFHAVVKPQGEARPAWKVLRVLANLLGLPGFAFESTAEVLKTVQALEEGGTVPASALNNATAANAVASNGATPAPVVASIYQLDSIVRRAPSLQLTADARNAASTAPARAEEALA